jgi:TPR repeat protein
MSRLLRCVARAVIKNAGKFLFSLVPGGAVLYDIAYMSYMEYHRDQHAEGLRAEILAMARVQPLQFQAEVQAVVGEVAGLEPKEVQEQLAGYLSQMPASIRRSLRRFSDPAGATVPAEFKINHAEDLLPLLPSRPPRFRLGQRPIAGLAWELVELLGSGGFGEVWLARHATMKSRKPVALKFCLDPAAAKVLRNEAGLLDQLQQHGHHPGIVPLQEVYLDNDPPCLQYEYVAGGDLAGLLKEWARPGQSSPAMATRLFQQLVKAVAFAHRARPPIVHCDLKPTNVLLERLSEEMIRLRITDFGIGGLAAQQVLDQSRDREASRQELLTDAVRGAYTPLYASPEQKRRRRGEPADPRDDVHALGVIWYQLLSADLSLDRIPPDWRDVLVERGVATPQLELLARCIASKAEKRPANAVELEQQLAAFETRSAPVSLSAQQLTGTIAPVAKRVPVSAGALTPTDSQLAVGYRKAAEQGDADAQCHIGWMYDKGLGVPQSDVEAARWYRQAAEQGNVVAQFNLGWMCRNGRGVPQSDVEAVAWYRRAAEQGNAAAQFNLGWMCCQGKGVARNDAEAAAWWRKAAEQGDADSQCNLGWLYDKGRGVPQSDAEAARWYRQAADQGHAHAQRRLAEMACLPVSLLLTQEVPKKE